VSENLVQVKLEALFQEFKTQMGAASASVSEAAAKMKESLATLATSSQASTATVGASFVEMGAVSTTVTEGMIASLEALVETLLPMAVVFGAAFEFSDSIHETVDLTLAAGKMSRVLGETTEQASIMNVALKQVHGTTEEYLRAVKGLDRQIRSNEEAVKSMGVVTRDSNGAYRDQNDIMLDAFELLKQYRDGTDRNLAAQQIFGRGITLSTEMLALNRDRLAEAGEEAVKYGLVIGGSTVDAVDKYRASTINLNEALEGMKIKLGTVLMPVMARIATFITENLSTALSIAKVALDALIASMIWFTATSIVPTIWAGVTALGAFIAAEGVATAASIGLGVALELLEGPIGIILALTSVIYALTQQETLAETAARKYKQAMDEINGIAAISRENAVTMTEALYGETSAHLAAAKAALIQEQALGSLHNPDGTLRSDMSYFQKGIRDQIALIDELSGELEGLAEKNRALHANQPGDAGGRSFVDPEAAAAAEAARKKALAEQKAAAAAALKIEIDAYNARMDLLKEDEVYAKGHWDRIFAIEQEEFNQTVKLYGEGSREAIAAANRILASARAAAAEAVKVEQIKSDAIDALALSRIDAEESAAKFEVDIGASTQDQLIAQQIEFENRRFDIKHAALVAAAAAETEDVVRHEGLLKQIEEMEAQHQLFLQGLRQQSLLQAQSNEQRLAHSVTEAAADTASKLLTGQMTLRDAERSILRSMLGSFTEYLKQKLLASNLFARLELAIHHMVDAILRALHIKAAVQDTVTNKVKAVSAITTASAVATANGIASFALAPWPIDLGAPAFGLAMGAAALSSLAGVAAESGYDIPQGVNPITQLHQREMVLPEAQANVVRDLADNGGGGKGGDTHNHFHSLDARSFFDFIRRNPGEFAKGLESAFRTGHIKAPR
jgi:hypothetical protein